MTVLDLSSYDLDTLNASCMKAAGVTDAILGVYSPTNAPNKMAQAAGKLRAVDINILGFYGLIYFGSPWGEIRDTTWAIALAKEFGVDRVWLDCETDAKDNGFTDAVSPTPADRRYAIQRSVALVETAGKSAGIYTGAWWWPSNTGNTTEFSKLPLWHAAYPLDGREIRTVGYGGWTDVAIHQYTSSLNVCGRNRDANYVFMEEEDALKLTETQTENLLLRVFAGSEYNGVETRAQRLERALRELDAADTKQSVNDVALSAGGGGLALGTPITIEGVIK